MQTEDLISIIIPAYDAEEYIGRCLESVLGQSYRTIEVIVVDDGSTDGTGAICREAAARDGRLRVVTQANGGPARARNAGLEQARGAWVMFVDADDELDREACRKLRAEAAATGADMVFCNLVNVWPDREDRLVPFCGERRTFGGGVSVGWKMPSWPSRRRRVRRLCA